MRSLLSSVIGYYLFTVSMWWEGTMANPFSDHGIQLTYLPIGFVVALLFAQFTRHFFIPSIVLNALLLSFSVPRVT